MCKKVIPFEEWKKLGEEKFKTDSFSGIVLDYR